MQVTMLGVFALVSILFFASELHMASPSTTVAAVPTTKDGYSFHLTSSTSEKTDHGALCIKEYGATATVADWGTDLKVLSAVEIKTLTDTLSIKRTQKEKVYFVTKNGRKSEAGDRQVYFFERHDGAIPAVWGLYDQHAGLSLGRWYDIQGQVLCRVKNSPRTTTGTTGGGAGDSVPWRTSRTHCTHFFCVFVGACTAMFIV